MTARIGQFEQNNKVFQILRVFVVKELFICFFTFAFLLTFVYYIIKGVIHQRAQNFLESPFFIFSHLFSRT